MLPSNELDIEEQREDVPSSSSSSLSSSSLRVLPLSDPTIQDSPLVSTSSDETQSHVVDSIDVTLSASALPISEKESFYIKNSSENIDIVTELEPEPEAESEEIVLLRERERENEIALARDQEAILAREREVVMNEAVETIASVTAPRLFVKAADTPQSLDHIFNINAFTDDDDEFEAALARDSAALEAKVEAERLQAEIARQQEVAAAIALSEAREMEVVDAAVRILDSYATVRVFFSNGLDKALRLVSDAAQRELERSQALLKAESDRIAAEAEALRLKEEEERERALEMKMALADQAAAILDNYIVKRAFFKQAVAETEKRRILEQAALEAAAIERRAREEKEQEEAAEQAKLIRQKQQEEKEEKEKAAAAAAAEAAEVAKALFQEEMDQALLSEEPQESESDNLLIGRPNEDLDDKVDEQDNEDENDFDKNQTSSSESDVHQVPVAFLTPAHSAAVGLVKKLRNALNAHIRSLLSPAGLAAIAAAENDYNGGGKKQEETVEIDEVPLSVPLGAILPAEYLSKVVDNGHHLVKSGPSSSSSSSSSNISLTSYDPEEFIDLLFSFTQKVAAKGGLIDQGLDGGQSGFAGAVITHESMSYALGISPSA
jgi:hypothetical protein